jgi:hypothetical protein
MYGIRVNAVLPLAGTRNIDSIPDADFGAWIHENCRTDQVAAVVVAMVHELVPFTGEAVQALQG